MSWIFCQWRFGRNDESAERSRYKSAHNNFSLNDVFFFSFYAVTSFRLLLHFRPGENRSDLDHKHKNIHVIENITLRLPSTHVPFDFLKVKHEPNMQRINNTIKCTKKTVFVVWFMNSTTADSIYSQHVTCRHIQFSYSTKFGQMGDVYVIICNLNLKDHSSII